MPSIDLAALRAEIEQEREWREAEMRLLRNQVAAIDDARLRDVARKALVVMLYAHFEGICKVLLGAYIDKINGLQLRVSEVAPALGAACLADAFFALRDPNRKCREFSSILPDDSALHRFARDRQFVEVSSNLFSRVVDIRAEQVVDTESNLKPAVLKKILYRLGLDHGLVEPWEAGIQQLLRRRNDVAHGMARGGISESDYANLEAAVNSVIDRLVAALMDAVSNQRYLQIDAVA